MSASSKLAKKMELGWRLMGDACPNCYTPLMQDRESQLWCVVCEAKIVRESEAPPSLLAAAASAGSAPADGAGKSPSAAASSSATPASGHGAFSSSEVMSVGREAYFMDPAELRRRLTGEGSVTLGAVESKLEKEDDAAAAMDDDDSEDDDDDLSDDELLDDDWEPSPEVAADIRRQNEASASIAQLLHRGWTLTEFVCRDCGVPLMGKRKRFVCVSCKREMDRAEAAGEVAAEPVPEPAAEPEPEPVVPAPLSPESASPPASPATPVGAAPAAAPAAPAAAPAAPAAPATSDATSRSARDFAIAALDKKLYWLADLLEHSDVAETGPIAAAMAEIGNAIFRLSS